MSSSRSVIVGESRKREVERMRREFWKKEFKKLCERNLSKEELADGVDYCEAAYEEIIFS